MCIVGYILVFAFCTTNAWPCMYGYRPFLYTQSVAICSLAYIIIQCGAHAYLGSIIFYILVGCFIIYIST